MANSVSLSILLTTHTTEPYFEALLDNVLQFRSEKIETIVINDAAGPDISRLIQNKVGDSNNDRVFLFEHERAAGRGASLNEALVQATGMLVWAPLRADRLNESLLNDAVRRFRSEPAAFWSLDYTLPNDTEGWIYAAEEGDLPDDSCLVWNRDVIPEKDFFFNPFLKHLHGPELAMRLCKKSVWHQTDPFFVVAGQQSVFADENDIEEFLLTAFRSGQNPGVRNQVLTRLSENISNPPKKTHPEEYLAKARQFLTEGDANKSLEEIEKFLKKNPDHPEANKIKIVSLEKLRRHVEAAELKHDLQKKKIGLASPAPEPEKPAQAVPSQHQDPGKPEPEPVPETQPAREPATPPAIELTVVVPTTGLGKPFLESAFLHLGKTVKAETTELIVIDNASLDDTFQYLEQLQEKGFLNIKVITNRTNKGFGASVNQGIEAASGEYILILHNDVILKPGCTDKLREAFNASGHVALSAPLINNTDIPAQKEKSSVDEPFVLTDKVESSCFMIRKDIACRFDEEYSLCHYDMDDFCMQILRDEQEIVVARSASADHNHASTTSSMGLKLCPETRWINRDYLHKKWGLKQEYSLPNQGTHPDRFERLGAPENPFDPDPEWVHMIQDYLTSEVKTEILRGDWAKEELATIVSTLLIADERELLRTLEDRLDDLSLPPALLILFVQYYFKKNIYSRCKHYLDMAGKSHPVFDLYRLKILVAEKNPEPASDLLNKLLDKFPASPDLYQLAGDIYRQNGDEDEARSFYAMAGQIDPFRFTSHPAAFEIRN